jgi:hypothetical protein
VAVRHLDVPVAGEELNGSSPVLGSDDPAWPLTLSRKHITGAHNHGKET